MSFTSDGDGVSKGSSQQSVHSRHRVSSPLHLVETGNLKELKRLINFLMLDPRTWQEAGTNRNLIHHAAVSNQTEVLQYLISETKVDINAIDSEGNTALHLAVIHGHLEALNILLSHNINDAILNSNKDPALHLAIRQCPGSTRFVSEFVKYQNVNLMVQGRHKRTMLHVIAENDKYLDALELIFGELLKRMHDLTYMLHTTDNNGLTPVHLSARIGSHQFLEFLFSKHSISSKDLVNSLASDQRCPLHYAVERGHTESIRVLLEHGGDPILVSGSNPPSFHLACSQGRLDIVKLMVERCGQTILQSCDREGGTALHSSTSSLHSRELISYLVDIGVNINCKDANGFTPLSNAILLGNVNAVEQLLAYGADPLIKDKWGRNSLHVAVKGKRMELFKQIRHYSTGTAGIMAASADDKGTYPIHSALGQGMNEMVSSLLLLTSEIFKDREGNNYLHLSSMSGDDKSLTQLLSKPTFHHMINEANHSGFTPLHYAAMGSNHVTVKKLLDNGAVIHKNHDGHTPFMSACSKGNLENAELVYNRNAFQRDWFDQHGNTALHLAVDGRNPKVITFCLDEGMAITLNDKQLSFLDKILEIPSRKLAEVALGHERWEECIDISCPDRPHPLMRIIDLIPDAYGIILDQCFTRCSLDPHHPDYWEKFNFKCLISKPTEVCQEGEKSKKVTGSIEMADFGEYDAVQFQFHTESNVAVEDADSIRIERKGVRRRDVSKWKRRMLREEEGSLAVVRKLIKNRLESHLLHPVVVAFIGMKWQGFGQYFHFILMFSHFLLALFLSIFLGTIDPPRQNITVSSSLPSAPENQSGIISLGMETISVGSLVLLYITLGVAGLNLAVFFLEMYIYGLDLIKNFTSEFQTWINFVAASCTIIFLISILVNGLETAFWNSAAIGIFLSWLSFGFNMQLFNILNIGIYITILISVTRLIFKVMTILFVFYLAFAFAFYVLVGTVNELQYTNIGLSLFSILHSLIAVTDYLGFVNLEQSGNIRFSNVVFLLLVCLVVMLPIVIINLLIGLAVGDIALIQKEAFISRQSIEVKALASLDKKLLPHSWTRHLSMTCHKHYPNSNKKWSWITSFFHHNSGKKALHTDPSSNVEIILKEKFAEDREFRGRQIDKMEERMEQITEDLEGIKRLEGMVTKLMEVQGL